MTSPDHAPRISGPIHPMVAAYRDAIEKRNHEVSRLWPVAARVLREHRDYGPSQQSVFSVDTLPDGGVTVEFVGPAEDAGDRPTRRGYFSVYERDVPRGEIPLHPSPGGNLSRGLREALDYVAECISPGGTEKVRRLRDALNVASKAGEDIGPVLALCAAHDYLEWSTGESVCQTAVNVCRDVAWGFYTNRIFEITHSRLLSEAMDMLHARQPVSDWAAQYLEDRKDVADRLERRGIELGGRWLNRDEFAERAKTMPSTLRSYVSRGQAPEADEGAGTHSPRWHQCTVAAWLLSRPNSFSSEISWGI